MQFYLSIEKRKGVMAIRGWNDSTVIDGMNSIACSVVSSFDVSKSGADYNTALIFILSARIAARFSGIRAWQSAANENAALRVIAAADPFYPKTETRRLCGARRTRELQEPFCKAVKIWIFLSRMASKKQSS
jgi:hypothetical protein